MSTWLAWAIAAVSTAACLLLWFREVRRLMLNRESTVESAAGQLAVCRRQAADARDDAGAQAVLERSEKIYRQAVDLYNHTLRKPLIRFPAFLMGFKPIS